MATQTMDSRTAISNYGFYAWVGLLTVIVVVGFVNFIRQTTGGHHLTDLSDAVPWGLYVTGYVFFVGIAAGATIVGLMLHAFGRKDYAPLATRGPTRRISLSVCRRALHYGRRRQHPADAQDALDLA